MFTDLVQNLCEAAISGQFIKVGGATVGLEEQNSADQKLVVIVAELSVVKFCLSYPTDQQTFNLSIILAKISKSASNFRVGSSSTRAFARQLRASRLASTEMLCSNP
jgi:hypothetical protein